MVLVAVGVPVGMQRLLSPAASPGCAWVTPGLPSLVVQRCPSGRPVRAAVVVVFAGAWFGCVAAGAVGFAFVPGTGAPVVGVWWPGVAAEELLDAEAVTVTVAGVSFPQAVSPISRQAMDPATESCRSMMFPSLGDGNSASSVMAKGRPVAIANSGRSACTDPGCERCVGRALAHLTVDL